jgi:hypothetical protein
MKNPVSLVFLCFLCLSGAAQPSYTLASLAPVTIRLKSQSTALPAPGAFNHFEVIDERPDTARIGIHTFIPTVGNTHNRQLVFRHPAATEIADYLNTHFTRPDAPWSALIILRGLWLSDANYLREERMKNPAIVHERTHIRLKAEIYAVRDSQFMPVLRYDTLQSYVRDNRYTSVVTYYTLWNRDLAGLLRHMADSASQLTLTKTAHSRRLEMADIKEFNESRFEVPITKEITLTPGVYVSFEEFKNNAPSISGFEIRLENIFRLLYIREGSSSYYSHQAWGCCDGKTIYVMRDGVLYPAFKESKAYYFLAPPTPPALGPDGKPIAAGYAATKSETDQRRIYTVDMDSGKVY